MAEKFDKVLEDLAHIMTTKDLGETLFNEAARYYDVLDSSLSTYEEKHKASALAEDLLSKTRDFPEIASCDSRGRR